MAYIRTLQDDEAQKAQAQGGAARSTSGVVDSTVTGGAPAGNGQPQQPAAPAQGMAGSGFQNLDQYLKTNKGAGAQMVGATTAGLVKDVNNYGTTAADLVKDSQKALTAAAGTGVQQLQANMKTAPGRYVEKAQAFADKKYDGPTAERLTKGLRSDRRSLTNQLGKVGNADTQTAALETTYGQKQPYTAGFGSLDQFLMAGQADARKATGRVQARAADVNNTARQTYKRLERGEEGARHELRRNQRDVRNTGREILQSKIRAGRENMANMNAALDPDNFDGVVQANLGDAIRPEDRLTMDALNDLSGGAKGTNKAWSRPAGYSTGTAKPRPEPVAKPDFSGGYNEKEFQPLPGSPGNPADGQPINTGGPQAGLDAAEEHNRIPVYDPGEVISEADEEKADELSKYLSPGVTYRRV